MKWWVLYLSEIGTNDTIIDDDGDNNLHHSDNEGDKFHYSDDDNVYNTHIWHGR